MQTGFKVDKQQLKNIQQPPKNRLSPRQAPLRALLVAPRTYYIPLKGTQIEDVLHQLAVLYWVTLLFCPSCCGAVAFFLPKALKQCQGDLGSRLWQLHSTHLERHWKR